MTLLSSLRRLLTVPCSRPARRRPAVRRPSCRPWLEVLEDRTVPSTLSVANASLNEIGSPSSFVTAGSGGLSAPQDITLGPDGNVYVASNGGEVLRYNGTTGTYINTFVSQGSGGLSFGAYVGLAFGPDGNLYVSSASTNQVLEYNGSTGAFLQAFASTGSGGLGQPQGLSFGPDGNLYVNSTGSNAILCFQGPLSASPGRPSTFVASVVPPNTGGGTIVDLRFGPDGNLYVDFQANNGVFRFQGPAGASPGSPLPAAGQSGATFIPEGSPTDGNLAGGRGMAFDQEGRLYVSDSNDAVHRYAPDGAYLGDLLDVNSAIAKPRGMAFDAQGRLLIAANDFNTVVRYDSGVTVSLSAASSVPVIVDYATADGTATAGKDYYGQSGTVTFAPGQTTREILLATQEDPVLDGNETFSVQLSSDPNDTSGTTIANGTATVTIMDPTRSYSVADTSAIEGDHTAHYRGAFVQGIPYTGIAKLTFGPDGNLYTTGGVGGAGAVTEYNGTTGAFIGVFTPLGLIGEPGSLVFHGGYLYVSDQITNEVYRFNGSTGAFVNDFVTAGSGGINAPFGMAFDSAGNLYVSGRSSNNVVKYDTNGNPVWSTPAGSGGLSLPEGVALDPSGAYLYVANSGGPSNVLKFKQTGAYVGVAASSGVSGPDGIAFGPDGLLYIDNRGNNRILRYTESGAYVDDYVPASSAGMADLAFGPNGDLYVATDGVPGSAFQIMDFGTENEAVFTVTNTTPSTLPLTVNFATANGTAVAGANYAATSGTLTFAPGATTATIDVPILDSGSQTAPLTFTLTLSNPEAATLSRSQAIGTIEPSDGAAKFYVVNNPNLTIGANGGGNLATFKYQASGTEQAPFALSLADLDPMGVAANAAGTEEWVVDRNENVYAYSPGGTLLGSWSAGGLPAEASLNGIATDGTNIWLLDATTNKIFEYAGAAGRLSGSQNAASSFKLNRSDNAPANMVTDGKSMWVVDQGNGKVFKYTVAGTLLGSWAIDPANVDPVGITINPNNVSDIWIVDGYTLKVYDYTAAASRTSGKQKAAATFALAPGDAGPVGIADPPPADMLLTPTASSPAVVAWSQTTPQRALEQPSVTDDLIGGNGVDVDGGSGAGTPSGGGGIAEIDHTAGGPSTPALALLWSDEPTVFTGGGTDGDIGTTRDSANALAAFMPGGLAPALGQHSFLGDLAARLGASDGAAEWSPSDLAFLAPFDASRFRP